MYAQHCISYKFVFTQVAITREFLNHIEMNVSAYCECWQYICLSNFSHIFCISFLLYVHVDYECWHADKLVSMMDVDNKIAFKILESDIAMDHVNAQHWISCKFVFTQVAITRELLNHIEINVSSYFECWQYIFL